MADIDDRLDGRWKKDAQKTALSTMMEHFLTQEGREFFTIAVKKSDGDKVKKILNVIHEHNANMERDGERINVFDMAAAWLTIIQAVLASSTYQNERKSWEN